MIPHVSQYRLRDGTLLPACTLDPSEPVRVRLLAEIDDEQIFVGGSGSSAPGRRRRPA